MKKTPFIVLALSLTGLLASCGGTSNQDNSSSDGNKSTSAAASSSSSSNNGSSSSSSNKTSSSSHSSSSSSSKTNSSSSSYSEISLDDSEFSLTTEDGSFTKSDCVYTISASGTYSLSGTLAGQIVIDAEDGGEGVTLELNGVSISYDQNSPIYCAAAEELDISAKSGTENVIKDLRSLKSVDDDEQGGGAIYSKCDLTLKGKGSLDVEASYSNGVHGSDDLKIKNLTLNVTAPNNALKGNDSITIESGTLKVISTGGDGLKTENTDLSDKGNQRGTVTISGGTIDIYSACDGIDAAYDADINGGVVSIHTNKYSSYTGDIVSTSSDMFYIRMTSSYYSSSYRYAVYFYDDDGNYAWANMTSLGQQGGQQQGGKGSGQSSNSYYYYSAERPSGYTNYKIYRFNSSQSENSTTNYVAVSSGGTINTNYDTVTITVSGSVISPGSWSNYSSSQSSGGFPGGFEEGNTDKADSSAKGIKADNRVLISGTALIDITAYDDGLHANNGTSFDNGETGVGDVEISGGTTTISCSDDGVHADRYLNISGGSLTVTSSYEGLEGNQITVSGGTSVAYASDDGVNCGAGIGLSPSLTVTGGYLFASVPSSGDTDGIDSNGTISITGGTVITSGPNSNMAASALDAEKTVTLSGSDVTLMVFGGMEKTPSTSLTKQTKSGTYSSGKEYTVTFSDSTTVKLYGLKSSYSSVTYYSSHGSISSVQ